MRSESTQWLDSIDRIQRERQGRTLVFTNGVFDLLHAGHVTYLEQARGLGDLLVVALNTDDSVRRLGKGPERPLNPLADRARVIGALRCVDFVVSFDEDDPTQILAHIQPDIHVKGGDYDPETMPETPTVRSYGGRVIILPLLAGRSTTRLVKAMRHEDPSA